MVLCETLNPTWYQQANPIPHLDLESGKSWKNGLSNPGPHEAGLT